MVLVLGGYYGYKTFKGSNQAISYALAAVEKGTIVTSISGSGQVSALNQVDIKPKVSGDVVYIGVKNGQEVWAGALLVQLDARDAQKAVRDAQLNLDNARIRISKFKIDQGTTQDTRTYNLQKSYSDGLGQVSDTFLALDSIIQGINNVLYDSTVKGACSPNICQYQNFVNDLDDRRAFGVLSRRAEDDYVSARSSYDSVLEQYRNIRLLEAGPDTIKSMLSTTNLTLGLIAQAVKSEQNMIDALVADINKQATMVGGTANIPSQITAYQNNLASFFGTLNSRISGVSNSISSIRSQEQSLASTSIGDPLDLADQENSIAQKEAALQDAKDNLAKMYIRAPFAGIVGKINIKKGDSASGGTAVATMLTKQKIAEVSLNEVDVSKVRVGQKTTLTLDAIDGLTITGEVLEIDASGTVSQGVVTYNVKIGFDTQDERVKPDMSVSAAIITNIKQNVLLVPNSAIKSTGGVSYVEVPANVPVARQLMANAAVSAGVALSPMPNRQEIESGLANDSETEIVSGVNEGDLVVIRTITASTTKATTGTSLFSTGGSRPATGGARPAGIGGGR